jgi:hypothetical protein
MEGYSIKNGPNLLTLACKFFDKLATSQFDLFAKIDGRETWIGDVDVMFIEISHLPEGTAKYKAILYKANFMIGREQAMPLLSGETVVGLFAPGFKEATLVAFVPESL